LFVYWLIRHSDLHEIRTFGSGKIYPQKHLQLHLKPPVCLRHDWLLVPITSFRQSSTHYITQPAACSCCNRRPAGRPGCQPGKVTHQPSSCATKRLAAPAGDDTAAAEAASSIGFRGRGIRNF